MNHIFYHEMKSACFVCPAAIAPALFDPNTDWDEDSEQTVRDKTSSTSPSEPAARDMQHPIHTCAVVTKTLLLRAKTNKSDCELGSHTNLEPKWLL